MKNSRRLCFIIEDLTFISEVQDKMHSTRKYMYGFLFRLKVPTEERSTKYLNYYRSQTKFGAR